MRKRFRQGPGRRRDERGGSLIEFALPAPFLVLVLFGIVEFGFVFNDYLELRSGSREAARLAAVDNGCGASPLTCPASPDVQRDELIDAAKAKLAGLADAEDVRLSVSLPDGPDVGKDVLVCLNFVVKSQTGVLAPMLDNKVLRSKALMRLEQPATFTAGASPSDPAGTKAGAGPAPSC